MIELLLIAELNKPNISFSNLNEAQPKYSYISSQRRAGSGRRSMRKTETKGQVTTWLVEWTSNNGLSYSTETYSTYDSCNNRAKQLKDSGAYVSKWCLIN